MPALSSSRASYESAATADDRVVGAAWRMGPDRLDPGLERCNRGPVMVSILPARALRTTGSETARPATAAASRIGFTLSAPHRCSRGAPWRSARGV